MEFKRFVDKDTSQVPTIEVDKWEPHPEKKGLVCHVGMRTYGEVFEALQNHLKEMGMLPDEYFHASYSLRHKDNEPLPNYSEAVCHVNFGTNEGIYLDIMFASYGSGEPEYVNFATGKTLGTSVEAFYKMSMICAECSMMLNGRGEFVYLGERDLNIKVACVEREVEKEDISNDKGVDGIIADAVERSNCLNPEEGNDIEMEIE